jgi:hypothetical protein
MNSIFSKVYRIVSLANVVGLLYLWCKALKIYWQHCFMRWRGQANCMPERPDRFIMDIDFLGDGHIKQKHAAAITT